MGILAKPVDSELSRIIRWAKSANDWDLARELDSFKETRDSCQRQIGLLPIDNQSSFDSLTSKNRLNQQRIEVIEQEIFKRRTK
jgi:hypothetical protein